MDFPILNTPRIVLDQVTAADSMALFELFFKPVGYKILRFRSYD